MRGILCTGLALALVGCGPSVEYRNAALDRQALEFVRTAERERDHWKAYSELETNMARLRQGAYCERDFFSGRLYCAELTLDMTTKVHAAMSAHLVLAVKAGSAPAMRAAYASGVVRELVPAILASADAARGTAADRDVLHVAGLLVTDGVTTQRDTGRGVAYLARAWAAGADQAAGDAARVFVGLNDTRNAYLWSLRCLAPCKRPDGADLERLQAAMQPEAARQAQAASIDRTVVELGARS